MTEQPRRPTAEDFQSTPWESVLEAVAGSKNYEYANAFLQAGEEAQTAGHSGAVAVYRVLADLCSLQLDPNHPRQPFRATTAGVFSTADPDAVDPEVLPVLGTVAPSVSDPWLRARIADFVWTFQRDHRMARLAVASYLELTRGLEEHERWSRSIRSLERAVEVARQLGPRGGLVEEVTAELQGLLERVDRSQGMLPHALLMLCARHRLGDLAAHHDMAADMARDAERGEEWDWAERHWMLAEDFAGLLGDDEKRRAALSGQGESYVRRALVAAERPHIGKLQAVGHLQRAVEAFRRASMRDRSEEVQHMMIKYQRSIPGELIPIPMSSSIPIGDAVQAAQDAVSGKSLPAALLELAGLGHVPKYADLRRRAEENADRFMFRQFFPAEQLNEEGKVVGRERPSNASPEEAREGAIRVDMIQAATTYHRVLAQAVVQPALARITDEHVVRVEDFFWIVSNNPMVPAGRELLYAEAFQAAFEGDLTKAIHILVLQVEHSVREMLVRRGVLVTSLKDGVQMERGLNQLLSSPELNELLGEDAVFALQCVLVEGFGSNLRNKVAHGLMHSAAFREPECFYCWWLCFRLVCEPVIAALLARASDTDVEGEGDGEAEVEPS